MIALYRRRISNLGFNPTAMFDATAQQHAKKLSFYAGLLIELDQHTSVLDVGCGYGALLDYWQPRGEYLGIDVVDQFIVEAELRHPDRIFRCATVEALAEKYDVTVLAGVLSSTPDPLSLLCVALRRADKETLFDITIGDRLPPEYLDLNRITVEEVQDVVAREGMDLLGPFDLGESWVLFRARRPGASGAERPDNVDGTFPAPRGST
ncbi:MAG TPA: class I SAM-dependent methyltransferase [Pseudolysinimonas sp.]|jgi:SAM-dependent methyltransferase|nr:class I SAM-dependent methyltransferase [Pseudolysinimonas sp.]